MTATASTCLASMCAGVDVPAFAAGGVVTGPTLAMVGEGAEPEAIVPLSKAGQMGFGGNGNGYYQDLWRLHQ